MRVPFLDFKSSYEELEGELKDSVLRVLSSGIYIGGEEVEKFESSFAAYCGVKHVVGVANGLDALKIALLALGVEPGDEVIVPSHTFIATWLAVSQCGAIPIPVEPQLGAFNIDAEGVISRITERTKGIIAVHLYGQVSDLSALSQVAEKHGLFLLEDAAQAHGACYLGKRLGGHSHAVAWSFYPGKNLGAYGDGGAVSTQDDALAQRIRVLGNYGSREKYINEVIGFNSRLDAIQAAMLGVKLKRIDEWNERRRQIAEYYDRKLTNVLIKPTHPVDRQSHVWHLYVVRSDDRGNLQKELSDRGLGTLIHYPVPPHLQVAYKNLGYGKGSFPVAEQYASTVISLPIGPHLSWSQADYIVDAVNEVVSLMVDLNHKT